MKDTYTIQKKKKINCLKLRRGLKEEFLKSPVECVLSLNSEEDWKITTLGGGTLNVVA